MSAAKMMMFAANPGDDIARSMQIGVTNAMAVPQKVTEVNLHAGAEFMKFIGQRLRAQADLLDSLGKCRDFGEAAEAQRRFWDKASEDYANEVEELRKIASSNFAVLASLPAAEAGAKKPL